MQYFARLRVLAPAGPRMSFPHRFDAASVSRWLPIACGTYVLVGGLISLGGWAFDLPALRPSLLQALLFLFRHADG